MNRRPLIPILLILSVWGSARAQNTPPPEKSRVDARYALSIIDDATFYDNRSEPVPEVLNQVLVEPALSYRFHDRLTLASSMIGLAGTYSANYTQLRVKETYAGLSAGDFDFTLGRKIVRWGTGYAFTAAGVLDPPRIPTDPTDRLN